MSGVSSRKSLRSIELGVSRGVNWHDARQGPASDAPRGPRIDAGVVVQFRGRIGAMARSPPKKQNDPNQSRNL